MKHKMQIAGFSMVEVALALLVLSIGLLTIVGLFGAGLDMNRATIHDTQVTQFAEEILAGLRFQSDALATNSTTWAANLPKIVLHPSSGLTMWANGVNAQNIKADGSVNYVRFITQLNTGTLMDFGYACQISIVNPPAPYNQSGNVRGAVLKISPGEYGSSITNTFYTELFYYGM